MTDEQKPSPADQGSEPDGDPADLIGTILPTDFFAHLRAARREMLLAVRSVLDARIAALDESPAPARRRAHRISID